MITTDHIPTAEELNAMTPREHQRYESRLRRMARRQDLALMKSRRRDTRCAYCADRPLPQRARGRDHNSAATAWASMRIHAALLDPEALGVKVAVHPHFPFGYHP